MGFLRKIFGRGKRNKGGGGTSLSVIDPNEISADGKRINLGEMQGEANKLLNRDAITLNNLNLYAYPGQQVSEMSPSTMKAEAMNNRLRSKDMPYSSKLRDLASREATGLTPENKTAFLNYIKQQNDALRSTTDRRLAKQFNSSYGDYYNNRYTDKYKKNRDLQLGNTGSQIDELNNVLKEIENSANSAKFSSISGASQNKTDKNLKSMALLHYLGDQQHRVKNSKLTADRERYNAEFREPYEKLENLQRAISGTVGDISQPDALKSSANDLVKALKLYGVDTTKPVSEWATSVNYKPSVYQGQLVANPNEEMMESYSDAHKLDHKHGDATYNEKKKLRKEIMSDTMDFGSAIEQNIPEALKPKFELLTSEAKKRAKADLNRLNAKYIQQGMYGSDAHLKSAAERMNEINSAAYGNLERDTSSELNNYAKNKFNSTLNTLGKFNQVDQVSKGEFNKKLGDINSLNQTGIQKWKNDNHNYEQIYKNYQSEKDLLQPKLIQDAATDGFSQGTLNLYNKAKSAGAIDLSKISDLGGVYSNGPYKDMKTDAEYEKLLGDFSQLQNKHGTLTGQHNTLTGQHNSLQSNYNNQLSSYNSLLEQHKAQLARYGIVENNYNSTNEQLSQNKALLDGYIAKIAMLEEQLKHKPIASSYSKPTYLGGGWYSDGTNRHNPADRR